MKIVYYSASGNTEKMANLIAEGIANSGKNAEVINVSNANADIFDNEEIVPDGMVKFLGNTKVNEAYIGLRNL